MPALCCVGSPHCQFACTLDVSFIDIFRVEFGLAKINIEGGPIRGSIQFGYPKLDSKDTCMRLLGSFLEEAF